MAKIGAIERRIGNVEQFNVRIRHLDGRNVRSDMDNIPQYHFERAARDAMTVADWIEQRFRPSFPGFGVQVLDGNGEVAHGNTLLENVRDSYED